MSKKLHHLRGTLSRMVETGTKWPWAAAAYQSQLLRHIEKLTQRLDELEKRVTELEASIDEDAAEQMRFREQWNRCVIESRLNRDLLLWRRAPTHLGAPGDKYDDQRTHRESSEETRIVR